MNKVIRKLIREALGVPEGILDSSKKLWELIFKKISKIDPNSKENGYTIPLNISIKIGDYTINKINFTIKTEEYLVKKPDIAAFGFGSHSELQNKNGNFRLNTIISDEINLLTIIAVPHETEWTFKDIVDLFINNKDKVLRSLSHELKHAYDAFKKPTGKIYDKSLYAVYAETKLGIPPVDEFLNNLYFIHSIENLVRPSEIAMGMESKGVTKKTFLDFLLNDEVYSKLSEISKFDIKSFKNELKEYIPTIDNIFEKLNMPTNISDDEKVEQFMSVLYSTITNIKIDSLRTFLQNEVPEKLFNILNPSKNEFFNKTASKISRFKSYKDFFEYEEKMFKYVSIKLMKKISKLYAMSQSN